ncbi:MAG: hypothetical protein Q8J69_03520 [Sphingobacteriaceae bacterium]|nr:hypothetical protein [Sphingobacteriaceae bacterium]
MNADSLIFHFTDMGGKAAAYLNYIGIVPPLASRIMEDTVVFNQKINYQFHTIELTEGDSVIYSSPLKLFNPALLSKTWPISPGLKAEASVFVPELPYFHVLDYLYADKDGFWIKSDNNVLYKIDYQGKQLFSFSPEKELPWQSLYASVLKKQKIPFAQQYFGWFNTNNRYAFPMYDVHVSTDGHIYVHCAAQPFEKTKLKNGEHILSAEPYGFLLKIDSRTFEKQVIHTADEFNLSDKTYYDFDHLFIQGQKGYVSTEVSSKKGDVVGLSSFKIKNETITKAKRSKIPEHGNPDFLSQSYINSCFVETKEHLFLARSRDSLIIDLNNPLYNFTLPTIANGRSFNLQSAGRVSNELWFLYHQDESQNYFLTILQRNKVIVKLEIPSTEPLQYSKAFIHEKMLYIPTQTANGQLELKKMALQFTY